MKIGALKLFIWVMITGFYVVPLSLAQSLSEPDEIISLESINSRDVQFTGWDKYLGLGLTGTLNENKNVVGKDDGQSTTLGLKVEGAVDFKEGQHLWTNTLNVFIAYSRTPQLPNYLKSEDTLQLESLYKYYFESISWLGLFSRVNFDTAVFPGYDTRTEVTSYRKVYRDGSEEVLDRERIRLTDSFRPVRFRESVGGIAQLIDHELFRWDVKVGLGMRQILAKGQFVLDNDSATPEIDLRELANYEKAGYEFGTEIAGQTDDKRVTYKLRGDVLFPFYESPEADDERSNFDKRIIDINGTVSFHLLDWASLDYLIKAVRDPDILSRTQLSQTYLFSVNKTITPRRTH